MSDEAAPVDPLATALSVAARAPETFATIAPLLRPPLSEQVQHALVEAFTEIAGRLSLANDTQDAQRRELAHAMQVLEHAVEGLRRARRV